MTHGVLDDRRAGGDRQRAQLADVNPGAGGELEELIRRPEVRRRLRAGLAAHNRANPASSRRIGAALLLAEPPSIDAGARLGHPRLSIAIGVTLGGLLAYLAIHWSICLSWSLGHPGFFYLRARRFANGLSPFVSLGWLGGAQPRCAAN